jgi:hypothetical protein
MPFPSSIRLLSEVQEDFITSGGRIIGHVGRVSEASTADSMKLP